MAKDPIKPILAKWRDEFENIRKVEEQGDSEIQTLFRGAVIFITGGTGFVGKQLLEKLLRSCRGIEKVYLLMRSKRGRTIAERLDRQLKGSLYEELRSIDPDFSKRVFAIQGDVNELNLGINDAVWNRIKNEIHFIYHIAATVRFDEPLQKAVLMNVRGTREILNLANGVPNLKALVHVSSAYANCNRERETFEVIYDTPVRPETLVEMAETMDAAKFAALSDTLTEGWPNTYTFSKAVAENLIKSYAHLPICIIRPSIITPTVKEPALGWVDMNNLLGPSGIFLGSGLGVIHTFLADGSKSFDLVPLDYVNNLAITATWDTVRRTEAQEHDIKVFTCSRNRNPITLNKIYNFLTRPARDLASPKAVWYCFTIVTQWKWLFYLNTILLHFIPAFIIDIMLNIAGEKPRLTHVYIKAYKVNSMFRHFLFNEWAFHDDNTVGLISKMSEADKKIYEFDMKNIDLTNYLTAWCVGLRKYVMKDELKDTEYAIKKQKWLKLANYVFFALYGFALWYVLQGFFNILYHLAYVITSS